MMILTIISWRLCILVQVANNCDVSFMYIFLLKCDAFSQWLPFSLS